MPVARDAHPCFADHRSPVAGCTVETRVHENPVHVCIKVSQNCSGVALWHIHMYMVFRRAFNQAGPTKPYCPEVFPLNIFDNQIKYDFTLDVIFKNVIYIFCFIVSFFLVSGFCGLSPRPFPLSASPQPFSIRRSSFDTSSRV